MSKRRKITLTETEYNAIISAWAIWYANDYENEETEQIEYGTPMPRKTKETNRALERIQDKWRTAGR